MIRIEAHTHSSYSFLHVLPANDLEPVVANRMTNGQQDALSNDTVKSAVTVLVALEPKVFEMHFLKLL